MGIRRLLPIYMILFRDIPTIIFVGNKKKTEQTADKAAGVILTNWICFVGSPDIILADKGAILTGPGFFSIFSRSQHLFTEGNSGPSSKFRIY